ncbi:MAG: hypothetical protein ACI9V1_001758 [Spirosomataceae bacterium]|jgi:hypothetical protein
MKTLKIFSEIKPEQIAWFQASSNYTYLNL